MMTVEDHPVIMEVSVMIMLMATTACVITDLQDLLVKLKV